MKAGDCRPSAIDRSCSRWQALAEGPAGRPLRAQSRLTGRTVDARRDFDRAVPTPDHFIPALYLAGLAGAVDTPDTGTPVDG
jgi:hypothetical protein